MLLAGDPINGPWTLANQANPLPVELVTFDAKLVNDKVKIWWQTATELENDFFTVERTVNNSEFDFIAKLNSKGPSASTLDYETYDYHPLEGLQYYRLITTDKQGNENYSKLVPVKYGKDGLFEIDYIIPNYSSNSMDVFFHYDSSEPFTYSVVDILGRTMISKSGNAAYQGVNSLTIPVSLTKGIYFVVIENSQKKMASKIVY